MFQKDLLSLIYGTTAEDKALADLLMFSAFDEFFELDLSSDTLTNRLHTPNKYSMPVKEGKYSTVHHYTAAHIVHPEDRQHFLDFMNPNTLAERSAASSVPGVLACNFRLLLDSGLYNLTRFLLVTGENHGVPCGKWYLYVYDVQSQITRANDLRSSTQNAPERDPLTGLYRSEDFFRLAAQKGNSRKMCCISLDIDHFTLFNAVYGKAKANRLLTAFASVLLRAAKRWDGIAAYFGQDDFAMYVAYDAARNTELFNQLRSAIATYGNTAGFSPVLGVYVLEPEEIPGLDMYDKAMTAMLEAKSHQSERIVEYNATVHEKEQEEFQVLIDLQKAIADNRVEFFLQPQCHTTTGQIVGAEALVRMRDENGQLIPPGKFIPVLEKNGCIADLDKLVWRMVAAWIRSLLDQGITPVPVSINVSQMDIMTIDVVSYLYSLTQEFNIPTSLLKVEITESFYAERTEIVERFVKMLSQRGFTTLMDDFGSGYSSLNMLETLTVDILKLDMAFMRKNSDQNRRSITIIESIINMSKMMNLPMIIEGVENIQQVQFLESMGCRYAQGYYFHRPMPCREFEALLDAPDKIDYNGIVGVSNEQFHVREFLDENTFTDAMLNNVLGPVAFYSFDGTDLTINRFNQQFFKSIGDIHMESRQQGIQQYVVEEDRPMLFRALEEAVRSPANGGICEVRFYKSNGGVFWFHMHLFHLKNEEQKKIFYGQIEDVTEMHEQSLQFFDVLRQQSELCMRINLDQETIQYVPSGTTLLQTGLPSLPLSESMANTSLNRIPDPGEKERFQEFFNAERLRRTYEQGVYHETLVLNFLLHQEPQPIEFSTYYIRYSKEQDLNVFVFVKEL